MDTRKYQLFKTEMCRNWQEMGECRYSKKCRFAHGPEELRCLQRHVRYKTEICRTFHLTGTCLYGVRCTFIHDEVHVVSSPTISSSSSLSGDFSPNFFATHSLLSQPTTCLLQDDLLWGNMMFTPTLAKKEFPASIWSSLDRRYSSSSSASSSSLLSVPFTL
ncbi:hypothetical protein MFLAVUS_005195 [Mucor flavus]|uniref:C3H1-type domain-containing protein n=1 Tax=Mucor flavus TaxID=439312 RepID=A0ABP9YY09_9FUNG